MKLVSTIRPGILALALVAGNLIITGGQQSAAQCCGARTGVNQPRIVGGTVAPRGAYPWMTALVERGQTPANGQFCGGALIHPQWVLTAGHCVEDTTAARLDVIIGAYNLTEANGGGRRVQVTQIISHPKYGDVNGALSNDVALLKLATPVTDVPIIPLVTAAAQIAPGTVVKGMGFGTTTEGGNPSTTLRHVDLSIIANTVAASAYGGLTSVHLAAGVAAGGRDTCQGDSGGPLVVSDGAGGWMQAGVVSYGDGCARAGVPGIYANVLTLKPWILQNIGAQPPGPTDDSGNTIANAAALTLGVAKPGNLEAAGDVDMFQVSVSGAGTLSVSTTGTTAIAGTLQTSAGAVLAQANGSPNVNISSAITTAGNYYFAVNGATAQTTGAYSVKVSFTPTPVNGAPEIAVLGKVDISDGDNAPSDAKGTLFSPLNIGQSASATFTVKNTGTTALTLGAVSLSGADAAQFKVGVQPAAQVAAGRSTTFRVDYAPNAAGVHLAEISLTNNDADESPYNIALSGSAQDVAGDDHGDTIATATFVSVPNSIAGVLSDDGADLDVFKFTLTATTTLTMRTSGNLDTYGTLFNAAGRRIVEADDTATDVNFSIRRRLAKGTYYIMVEGYDQAETGAYTLHLTR